MTSAPIRPATPQDLPRIKEIAVAAGMFTVEEAEFFDEMLGGFFDGSMEGHQWFVCPGEGDEVVAASNYAPEPFSDRMWNLYFIAVDPDHQGQGLGAALMDNAESRLRSMGESDARVLIVETSSTDQYSPARSFYTKLGYAEEARIRQFYGPADDKVVFWKSLTQ